jgi:hypothetical protein
VDTPEKHMKGYTLAASLVGMMGLLSHGVAAPAAPPASGPAEGGVPPAAAQDVKQFLNLSLPGESVSSPVVLNASGDGATVARVARVRKMCDIQVLRRVAGTWTFLGDRGEALTGFDGTGLADAIEGPDGRLWAMACYTPFSNPQIGWKCFLYCFENGGWRIAGPEQGYPAGDWNDDGLHFLGSDEPVHHFWRSMPGVQGHGEEFLTQLRGHLWSELPVQELLRRTGGTIAWRRKDAWLIACQKSEDETLVTAYQLTGPDENDVRGPYPLFSAKHRQNVQDATVSENNTLAVFLREEGRGVRPRSPVACMVQLDQAEIPKPVPVPFPPHWRDRWEARLAWNPQGELLLSMVQSDTHRVRVYVLRNGRWVQVAEATQPAEAGRIIDHRLYVKPDGSPVVTWEEFIHS